MYGIGVMNRLRGQSNGHSHLRQSNSDSNLPFPLPSDELASLFNPFQWKAMANHHRRQAMGCRKLDGSGDYVEEGNWRLGYD